MVLCGISSHFWLLSPCTRQVTHALLTRPPLSHKIISPEGNQIKCFVRLACVKHAASVHPEPGSNSHVWVFSLQLCCLVKTNFVLLSEVFSSLVKGSILVKLNLANSFIQIESEFTVLKVFNFHWSVLIDSQNLSRFLTVQLSMFFVLLSCDSLTILSNRCSFVKHFFIFLNSVLSSLSCDSLIILSKCFPFVKNFFKLFYVKDKAEKEGFEPSRQFPDLYP